MEDFILKYKNFLKNYIESSDYEVSMEWKISLENFEKFIQVQRELEEKIYDNI